VEMFPERTKRLTRHLNEFTGLDLENGDDKGSYDVMNLETELLLKYNI